MAPSELVELRGKLEALRCMDLPVLRQRVELIAAQAELDDEAQQLAAQTGSDQEVVLIVLRAVWLASIDAVVHTVDNINRDEFKLNVRAGTLELLEALASGVVTFSDPVLHAAMRTAVVYGRSHERFVPIRKQFEEALTVVHGLPCDR